MQYRPKKRAKFPCAPAITNSSIFRAVEQLLLWIFTLQRDGWMPNFLPYSMAIRCRGTDCKSGFLPVRLVYDETARLAASVRLASMSEKTKLPSFKLAFIASPAIFATSSPANAYTMPHSLSSDSRWFIFRPPDMSCKSSLHGAGCKNFLSAANTIPSFPTAPTSMVIRLNKSRISFESTARGCKSATCKLDCAGISNARLDTIPLPPLYNAARDEANAARVGALAAIYRITYF